MDDVRALRYSPADVLAALSCPPEHDVIRLPLSGTRSRTVFRMLLARSTIRLRGLVVAFVRVRPQQPTVASADPAASTHLVCEVVATRTKKTPSLISHFSPVQFG